MEECMRGGVGVFPHGLPVQPFSTEHKSQWLILSDQPLNHMEVHGFKLFSLIASLLFMSDNPTNPFNLDT